MEKDRPNIVAPPPLIFIGGLFSGFLADWILPMKFLPKNVAIIAGIILIFVSLAIIFTAIAQMRRAKTNVEPWKPTTAILDSGLYAKTRNPIYLAMISGYLGAAFLLNSFWSLPFLLPVILMLRNGVILREEKYLEGKFGAEYLNYKAKVRRWF